MTKTLAKKIDAYCKQNMPWWDYEDDMNYEHVPAKQTLKELVLYFGDDLSGDIKQALEAEIAKEQKKAEREERKALEEARKNAQYGIMMYGKWIYFNTMKEAVAWALEGLCETEGCEQERYAAALKYLKEGWNFINTDVAC